MGTPVTLIPGDGIGPSISERHGADPRGGGRRHRVGRAVRGPGRRSRSSATRSPTRRSTPSSARGSRSRARSRRRWARASARSTSRCARRSTSTRTCAPRTRSCRAAATTNIDLVLIRENTEGLYVGIEHYIKIGDDPRAAAESMAIITRAGSERIVRYAFEYAVKHGRKKVTLVHKANILKFSQGLFLDVGRKVAQRVRRTIEFEERDRRRDGDEPRAATRSASTSSSRRTCSATSSPT